MECRSLFSALYETFVVLSGLCASVSLWLILFLYVLCALCGKCCATISRQVLTHSIPFSPDHPADFFTAFPAAPAVFCLRGADEMAEPYVSKTANLRRRLQRLLAPPESQSKRLNLRERAALDRFPSAGGILVHRRAGTGRSRS